MRSLPILGLIAAESLSLFGNQIAAVAIPLLVLQFTNSPLMTGIASAGNIIPILLAAILGGRAIDRLGAWNISVVADFLSFCSVLVLPFAFVYLNDVSPSLIFLLIFLGALFDPTGISARQTLVPGVTKLSGIPLARINSWRGGLENGADFIGPIVGVALIGVAGILNAFFVNAITFLLSAIIFAIAVPRKQDTPVISHAGAKWMGVRFIFQHPQLKALAMVGMMANFVILPFLGLLLPVLATQKFGSNTLLGISLSVFGLAATIGATSFSWLSRRYSRSVIYYGGLLTTGVAIIFCSFATHPCQVIGTTALAGLLLGAGNPLQQTVLQAETPEAIAGQVFTSLTAIHFIGGPLGLILTGMMAELMDVEWVLLSAGGLLCPLAIGGWCWLPLLRSKQPI